MEFKNTWIITKVNSLYEDSKSFTTHRKTIVGEDDDFYYVTSETPKKIPKSKCIHDESEAIYTAMKDRLFAGIKFTNKQAKKYDIINKLKKDYPQYFI